MLRRLHIFKSYISFLILPVLLSLFITPMAHATSSYDDVVQITNAATIKNGNITNDISNSWSALIADCDNWYEDSVYDKSCAAFNADLTTAYSHGIGWAVGTKEVKSPFSTGASGTMDIGDKIVQVAVNTNMDNYGYFSGAGTSSRLNLSSASFTQTCSAYIYYQVNYNSRTGQAANPTRPQVVGVACENSNKVFTGIAQSHTEALYNARLFFFNSPIDYPPSYEGVQPALADNDEDGLNIAKETAQGTSDDNDDSDGDGLSDYIESRWYANRSDVFCGSQCAYPNPTRKDVYVEADWMNDSANEYKLSLTQVNLVRAAFEDKDINLHFDTGQYGGGGGLPTYIEALNFVPTENETDFFNLKNGDEIYQNNFLENRRGIWHYMITGDKLNDGEANTTSGVSYAGDDDTFVALGQIARTHPSTQDQAIAGTVIHELGHNLCLSNTAYAGQDSSCLFSGIDTEASNDYNSSMNYTKQFSLVNYSNGSNGQNDHNDWAAVLLGMGDFVTLGTDPHEPSSQTRSSFNKTPIYD